MARMKDTGDYYAVKILNKEFIAKVFSSLAILA